MSFKSKSTFLGGEAVYGEAEKVQVVVQRSLGVQTAIYAECVARIKIGRPLLEKIWSLGTRSLWNAQKQKVYTCRVLFT